ncbi:MAG: hypothetical protein AAF456_25320, partial [Planctomycetota bacterium]
MPMTDSGSLEDAGGDIDACQFVFAPGWAMEPAFFAPLIARLGIADPRFSDRSYFADSVEHDAVAVTDSEWPGSDWIGIGHSLGFLRLASGDLKNCKALISLNGFTDFCADGGTSRRIIERMHRKLRRSPEEVVRDFRQRCGPVVFTTPDSFNLERLSQDLLRLADDRIDTGEKLAAIAGIPVLALASADDPVVPLSLCETQFKNIRGCPGGRHHQGTKFGYWCSHQIQSFLSKKVSG